MDSHSPPLRASVLWKSTSTTCRRVHSWHFTRMGFFSRRSRTTYDGTNQLPEDFRASRDSGKYGCVPQCAQTDRFWKVPASTQRILFQIQFFGLEEGPGSKILGQEYSVGPLKGLAYVLDPSGYWSIPKNTLNAGSLVLPKNHPRGVLLGKVCVFGR